MAKKGSKGAGGRGPAKEIRQGDAKVGQTSAGKPRKSIKGKPSAALKVPGAIKG
jgi:hypothetical protein